MEECSKRREQERSGRRGRREAPCSLQDSLANFLGDQGHSSWIRSAPLPTPPRSNARAHTCTVVTRPRAARPGRNQGGAQRLQSARIDRTSQVSTPRYDPA